jgi:hypothetical protein
MNNYPVSQIKDKIKDTCINIYGWSGSLSVITAYGLTTFENDNVICIDILNLYGSVSIGYICFRKQVWQATILEIAWFCIGLYSLIEHILEAHPEGSLSG